MTVEQPQNKIRIYVASLEHRLPSEFPPLSNLICHSADNRMDAATKSRTSEDILRSSRLSAYSPEPCSQSESDYYPYTSSPRGTNQPSPTVSHHKLPWRAALLPLCRTENSAASFFVTLRLSLSVRPLSLVLARSRLPVFVPRNHFHLFSLPQPIGCRGGATRREETRRVGATAFKE